jgi:hypothetical protein
MTRGETTVETAWGTKEDRFDPISQITDTTVIVNVTTGTEGYTLKETAPQRCFTGNEFAALVRASGRFEIAEIFGAVDSAIEFSNAKEAWRMVPILRRR